jgi:heme oxygenase
MSLKQIFNECGFSNIWKTELFDNVDYLKCVIKQRLEDQFLQNWNSLVQFLLLDISSENLIILCLYMK